MFSTKFDCDFVDLMGAYRQSDRYCPPSNWVNLSSTRVIFEKLTGDWDCNIEDILIRRGKGSAASCWVHPCLEDNYKDWASNQKVKTIPIRAAQSANTEVIDRRATANSKEPQIEDFANKAVEVSSAVTIFNFENHEVRFVGTDEAPEWVGRDIVSVLYPEADERNYSNYLAKVPDEWKGHKQMSTPGGQQQVVTIFESGLYYFIARSNSRLAVPFQKWVFEDILPSIRKTRTYSIPNPVTSAPQPEQPKPSSADGFIQMIERDLEEVGVGRAFVMDWKYSSLKALHPEHAQMFDSARSLLMRSCPEDESLVNVSTIGNLINAEYNLAIMPSHLNKILVEMGYQILCSTSKCRWVLTDVGKRYGQAVPYHSTHGKKEHQGFQVLWKTSITKPIYEYLKTASFLSSN